MEYVFSWGWFFFGLVIILAGGALVRWHRPIADNLGSGVASYERYKLWGLIACGVGLVFMLNLHVFILKLIFSSFFGAGN